MLASPVPRLIMLGLRFVSRHKAFIALGFLRRASAERWWVRSIGDEDSDMAGFFFA